MMGAFRYCSKTKTKIERFILDFRGVLQTAPIPQKYSPLELVGVTFKGLDKIALSAFKLEQRLVELTANFIAPRPYWGSLGRAYSIVTHDLRGYLTTPPSNT